jgi:hypothetical protein
VQGPGDEPPELDVERLVETELGPQLRALLLRRVLADHEVHRVAGEREQPEGDERDHRHHDERLQDAAKDEGEQERAVFLAKKPAGPGCVKGSR